MPYFATTSNANPYITKFAMEPEVAPMLQGLAHWDQAKLYDGDQRLPQDGFYKRARSIMGTRHFPHILNFSPWHAFSEDMKNLIEQFEPGTHQFSPPVETFYKDGRLSERKYYCFQFLKHLDNTIILEKSSGHKMTRNGVTTMDRTQHNDTLTLDIDVVGSCHFWIAKDFFLRSCWFFSDELHDAWQKQKLRGLDFTHTLIDKR